MITAHAWNTILEKFFLFSLTFKEVEIRLKLELLSQIMRRSSFAFEENNVFTEEGKRQTKLIQLRKNKMELI